MFRRSFVGAKTVLLGAILALINPLTTIAATLRPPAVPLVTFDPYLSIWSEADRLTDDVTRHWTRRKHPLVSLIRVDGQAYRLMGTEPKSVPAMRQVGLEVTPTRSIYTFEDSKVRITLTFMTPALPHDLEALAFPGSYLTWSVLSTDGQKHAVSIFSSTSSLLAVNHPDQRVNLERGIAGPLTFMRAGAEDQSILGSSGDDHRIDWGHAYATAASASAKAAIGGTRRLAAGFAERGELPTADDARLPRPANDDEPVMAFAFDLGKVGTQPITRQVIVAYDEIYAIKYFGRMLRPYWRRKGASAEDMLQQATRAYPSLAQRCAEFDAELMADTAKAGGQQYAQICALAYRQCAAACGLAADANQQPLFFTKENTSNGDIGTVDVFYPMDPQWILLSPTLAKATLVPILTYASSWHWKFPNAPHDLGTYPNARGTDDGGEGMPVEESGNMLILCDAVAQAEGKADFVSPWWPKLTQWARYLERYGLDPENQLCTDDFMGHLAHNANLSVKAILGLAAYGDLCRMRGDAANAAKYHDQARADAEHWMKVAAEGDHYRLAFDRPNTWSQKYNLVWDRILGLNIFPPSVAQREVAFYKTVLQKYGLPLDSRTHLTKTDWTLWSATLAETTADFDALISPLYDYLNHTTARSPLADSYRTDDVRSDGMHARPVIGGVFIKMLTDRDLWQKWAARDTTKAGPWAELPPPPKLAVVLPAADRAPAQWHYTTAKPAADWFKPGYDSSAWQEGKSGFGTAGTPGARVGTLWNTSNIWLRREFEVSACNWRDLQAWLHHDEDAEVYINGVLALHVSGFVTGYELWPITAAGKAALRPGKNLLAVHCHQTLGGQYIDLGFVDVLSE
jgi:Glutaminase A six helical-hairpin domain/Domain of unknown function (DUF5127)/Domain of unknown function (DUF4964)